MFNQEKYDLALKKLTPRKDGTIIGVRGMKMKPRTSGRGYPQVSFYIGKRYGDPYRVQLLVHRLVAQTFLGRKCMQVNHKDGNKQHSRLSNLEFVTAEQNVKHRLKTNLQPRGEEIHLSKLKEEDLPQIRFLIKHNFSYAKIGRMFCVTEDCVGRISRGQNWKQIL